MSTKRRLVAALLRIYPLAWRAEYGPELEQILADNPLTTRVAADVLWSALRERILATQPANSLGLAMALLTTIGLAWNIAALPPYGSALTTLIAPSVKTLPQVVVAPLISELYVTVFIACGWCSWRRDGRAAARCGLAAAKLAALAGLPVALAGFLMWNGVLGVEVIAPGNTPTPFAVRGLTFSYYHAASPPAPWAVLTAPLFALPGAWLWGVIGGVLARSLGRNEKASDTSGV